MPSKELNEKVARAISPAAYTGVYGLSVRYEAEKMAEAGISTVRAALLEDQYLHEIIESYFNMPHGRGYGKDRLSAFLAASALGEQSE